MWDNRRMRFTPILLALACSFAPAQTPAPMAAEPPAEVPIVASSPAPLDGVCGGASPAQDDRQPDGLNNRLASSKDPCAVADNNIAREGAGILGPKPLCA